jgi:hypothetical protein
MILLGIYQSLPMNKYLGFHCLLTSIEKPGLKILCMGKKRELGNSEATEIASFLGLE